ncbi:MAG: amino acid adenylation domain-containing protein [Chloroflexi bacterium]|nr:MAG: amino acid adenylation domain-containing protein [Chloroflexota bacterium]
MTDLATRLERLSSDQRASLLRLLQGPGAERGPRLRRRSPAEPLRPSYAQQQLWFVDRLGAGRARNNVIAARHAVLRTAYREVDGQPQPVVAAARPVDLPVVDLSGLPAGERERRLAEIVAEQEATAFDLERRVLRALLVALAPEHHVLVWCVHHIAWDSGSRRVFFAELGALYPAFAAGHPASLPDLPVQYSDYAAWQRETLEDARGEELRAYWRRRLAGVEAFALPTDRPRGRGTSFRSRHLVRYVEPDALAGVKRICGSSGATLYVVLLAALDALFHRYTGRRDIVIGAANAARPAAELRPLTVADAFAHQALPFEQVVGAVNPDRDPARNPLFEVEFTVFENDMREGIPAGDLVLEVERVPNTALRFDMSVLAWEDGDRLCLCIEYNVDLFDQATVDRLIDGFAGVVRQVAARPEARVSSLEILGTAEVQRLTAEWALGPRRPGPGTTLDRAFADQVARTPHAPALTCAGTTLTYAELHRRASRLARRLRAAGVGPERTVGIALDRSVEMIVAVLAVLEAGGAYLPLDLSHPAERLRHALAESGAEVVVTHSALAGRIPAPGLRAVLVDGAGAEDGGDALAPTARPENLAYVLFTSGSTGVPKGVMVEHRSVVAFVRGIAGAYGIDGRDSLLQFAALGFDVSVFDVFAALLTGARLVVAGDRERAEPRLLTELLRSERVTVAELPPVLLPLLDPDLPDLRLVSVGGETFPGQLVERWTRGGRRFVNGYGPTETTVAVTLKECAGSWERTPPIGRPMANHQALVLDGGLRPLPPGVPGELCVAGAGVARGYAGRPALTAACFVPNPHPTVPGERIYRTGDLARWLPDGDLEFAGRLDRQVKVRGFRVELAEVEAVLGGHPAVVRCAVEVAGDGGGTSLVAYVEPAAGAGATSGSLRDYAADRLPAYMVPARVVVLDRIPLTANGKIDRRALPAPDDSRPDGVAAFVAPRTELERRIAAEVFAAVLELTGVGVTDDFFALGGNSIQAMQAVSRLRSVAGVEVPLADFFETPTVERLAGALEAGRWAAGTDEGRLGTTLDGVEQLSDEEAREYLALLEEVQP